MRAAARLGWTAALLLGGAGCATFIRGSTTTVTVRSDAPGAEVVVDGEPRGVTPLAMAMDHTVDHDVLVRSGNAERAFRLVSGVEAGWVVLDFFTAGIIGLAVDAATGAWRALSQESIYAAFGAPSLLAPGFSETVPSTGAPVAPVAPWTAPR